MYSGWVIPDEAKKRILNSFTPSFEKVICHHVTYMFGDSAVKPEDTEISIYGYHVRDGVECLSVRVALNGDFILERPDGGTFHTTLSLDQGRKPVQSNDCIANTSVILVSDFGLDPITFTGIGFIAS